jgi:hypothetical protein
MLSRGNSERAERDVDAPTEPAATKTHCSADLCERRDSNPHGLPHQLLRLARLPITPLSHCSPRYHHIWRAITGECPIYERGSDNAARVARHGVIIIIHYKERKCGVPGAKCGHTPDPAQISGVALPRMHYLGGLGALDGRDVACGAGVAVDGLVAAAGGFSGGWIRYVQRLYSGERGGMKNQEYSNEERAADQSQSAISILDSVFLIPPAQSDRSSFRVTSTPNS